MKSLILIYIFEIVLAVVLFARALHQLPYYDERKLFPMLMPNVQPKVKDTYLCTAFRMPRTDFNYVVEFTPNATQHIAHHILIYGCHVPGRWERDTPRLVWDCGEMHQLDSGFKRGPICESGSQVVYAWAKDAPPLKLPAGVAFKVGENTGINYLVLQVHYGHVEKFINGGVDQSGIILSILPSYTEKVTNPAGVLLMAAMNGSIFPGKKEHFEVACRIDEPIRIHPFAFRTHTHALGKIVSGYKVDKRGNWTLIGKHNPQEPQMFYPAASDNIVIEPGDIIAQRCTMYNFRDKVTAIGDTANDEMCNFYMMYYADGDKPLQQKYCFSDGPKDYYWITDPKIGSVPKEVDKNASVLDA